MALEQKLQLRLAQKLVMTPSLQQAIKLLQMTRLELQSTLTQELVENPTLEETETIEETPEDAEEVEEPEEVDPMEEIDLEAYFNDYLESSGPTSPNTFEARQAPPLENTLSREPDLYDHLLWQLHMTPDLSPTRQRVAELVIGNLDPDGFLVASPEEIAAMGSDEAQGEPYAEEEVRAAIELVQSLDPPGIACRDLKESLLRQLDHLEEPEDSLVRRVIAENWELFLKRQFPAIAKRLGVDLHDLEPVVERISSLETRPGRKYNSERVAYVEPDVYVIKDSGEYVIQLNEDGLPRLRISKAYRQMLQAMKDKGQKEAKEFIQEKLRSAVWLIKSIDQRQRTIYKVATSIVKQQRDFLDRGIERLRPMVLRDVAEDIGMHESTVSRVVSNKYIHTPRGLFPMKFFFHSGIDRDYGGDISSLTVKRKIEQMISAEDPRHPLSDSELTRVLKREGINIARRTVAKYRDELSIPSSTNRRQIF
ncbi:MAG: RNA polymerase factor sigma-54 [Thermoanaerobaculia bacterium]|nr:RNA polymerase factor sigma-54 [Thermoanaerobaculia bacterium]